MTETRRKATLYYRQEFVSCFKIYITEPPFRFQALRVQGFETFFLGYLRICTIRSSLLTLKYPGDEEEEDTRRMRCGRARFYIEPINIAYGIYFFPGQDPTKEMPD